MTKVNTVLIQYLVGFANMLSSLGADRQSYSMSMVTVIKAAANGWHTPPTRWLYASPLLLLVVLVLIASAINGCSMSKFVAKSVGNALAEGGSVYASDNDITFVGDAVPFGLKTMEGLLAKAPRHRPLLVATASGFVQYAYVYVDLPALQMENDDPEQARELRQRAKRLYLRGRDYAVRALRLRIPDWEQRLKEDPKSALAPLEAKNVPELYWAAVALSAAVSTDKQDMDLLADLHLVEPMIQRALELDEDFDDGAIHQFLISFEASRPAAQGGSIEKARAHFKRAMELAHGQQASPLVSLAEGVSVSTQNRQEFETLLRQALSFDVETAPSYRLANLVAQKRARLLLSRIDDLFIGN
jgi:predicted anti-sigma-YlaC factor YlaD